MRCERFRRGEKGIHMNLNAIVHRSALTDCYALDQDTVVLNIRTGKDITAVNLISCCCWKTIFIPRTPLKKGALHTVFNHWDRVFCLEGCLGMPGIMRKVRFWKAAS